MESFAYHLMDFVSCQRRPAKRTESTSVETQRMQNLLFVVCFLVTANKFSTCEDFTRAWHVMEEHKGKERRKLKELKSKYSTLPRNHNQDFKAKHANSIFTHV